MRTGIFVCGLIVSVQAIYDDCFNCNRPDLGCSHFGTCDEFSGWCECPQGFAGPDCTEPQCGSPIYGSRRPTRPENTTCDCDDGWSGINCNLCTSDNACAGFMPPGESESAVCYKGGSLVQSNAHMCNVTNRKVLDVLAGRSAEVTFTCETKGCDLQLWVDQVESFYCRLNDCTFEGQSYNCETIQCECVPDRLLCGADGSIDISEWLRRSVKGPGNFDCDSTGFCRFEEPAMNQLIKFVFGDSSIELQCDTAECLHESQVPGWQPPEQPTLSNATSLAILLGVLGLLFLLFSTARHLYHEKETSLSLPSEPTIAAADPVSLQFTNISYRAHNQDILSDVSGSVPAGHVLAIIGGSGAGKTTLLDILARKNKSGIVTGEVYFNGSTSQNFTPGFVDQSDVLIPTLTVYETVLTSALLRLPKSMSTEAKRLRAVETLAELGIIHLRDQIVGSAEKRGLSGGEIRRVAIACELVTSPSILFLDEPTSGLDSYSAYNVVESLVTLAKNNGRTVVFTIHQPRSNIVALFDRFMLLAKGRCVFQGKPEEAKTQFAAIGKPCPQNYNIADFLIDVTMRADAPAGVVAADANIPPTSPQEPPTPADDVLSDDADADCADPDVHTAPMLDDPDREWRDLAFHRQQITRSTAVALAASSDTFGPFGLEPLVEAYKESQYALKITQEIENAISAPKELPTRLHLQGASLFTQFLVLARRTFTNLYRDPTLVLTHYGISIALGIICSYLYYHVANDISGFQNRLGLFFFLLSLFGFSTLTTLSLFSTERLVFLRERANGYYHPFAYYAAKVLLDVIPLRVIPPVVLGLIVYPLVGLNLEDKAPLKFLLILVLFNLSAAAIMLLIGILFADVGVSTLLGCLINLFGILFGGLLLNRESMPLGSGWLQFVSIYHYAYEALSVNEVLYLTLSEYKFGLQIQVPGAAILSAFGFDNEAVPQDIAGLAVTAILCLVLAYVAVDKVLVEQR